MKTAMLVLVVGIIALAAGGGMSFLGYQASSSTITVTNTSSFQTATTVTSASITTTTGPTQVSSQNDVYDHVYNIQAPGTDYCGYYDGEGASLDSGTISIHYTVTGGGGVDFWMLNSQQWTEWQAETSCTQNEAYKGMTSRIGATQWDTTVQVPSTDVYYFVFMNRNNNAVTVSLTVTQSAVTVTTEPLFMTAYSTLSSTWQTSALSPSQQQVGLGPLFFAGLVVLIIGLAGLLYSRRMGEGGTGQPTQVFGDEAIHSVTIDVTPPDETKHVAPSEATAVSSPKTPSEQVAKKTPSIFCPQCGTELSADSTFCKACGSKIDTD